MRLNFWIALLCLVGLIWFAWIQRSGKTEPLPLDGPRDDEPWARRAKPTGPTASRCARLRQVRLASGSAFERGLAKTLASRWRGRSVCTASTAACSRPAPR